MIQQMIRKLRSREDLSREEVASAMQTIMRGEIEESQLVEFLTLLRDKGETVEEVTGAAEVMREFSVKVFPLEGSKAELGLAAQQNRRFCEVESTRAPLIDTCGTGGDEKGTLNVSTATAFVVAGAGVPVAKHGNRSVSSKSGSADVLEALGVKIDLTPEEVAKSIQEKKFGFMFAPRYHPAMKYVMPARKKIGTRTIFNLLGPLTNPAGAAYQLMGVFDKKWLRPMAEILKNLGSRGAAIVHSRDGLDEITVTETTFVAEWDGKKIYEYDITPEEFGFKRVALRELAGGNAQENAQAIERLLKGERGAFCDTVLLNAALALKVAGLVSDLHSGLEKAKDSLDSGKAQEVLKDLQGSPSLRVGPPAGTL